MPLPEKWNLESVSGLLSMERVINKQAEFIAYLHDFRLYDTSYDLVITTGTSVTNQTTEKWRTNFKAQDHQEKILKKMTSAIEENLLISHLKNDFG